MIDLYTASAPNGYKISIALEEFGLLYKVKRVNISEGEQFKPEFLALNPNAKIPVIVDNETGQTVFESCAILLYLAEKTGKFMPKSVRGRWEVIQWLFFQAASIGPMLGQLGHFMRYAPEQIPYAIERYSKEAHRLFGILEERLEDRDFICSEYSIVDMAHFGWLYFAVKMGATDAEKYPRLITWHDRIISRPAVVTGLTVPEPSNFR
ncbi:glutathione S-transferase family protein [Mastigocoleus testarum]|uniref:Glutathione S-transferase n=1 Tax=Mastigocoleus testarum BC008 TaxID=371196 RepID=A0A0V7ZD02_9CYAN|nr:glutathione S-transferase N-terminal domain-containing protein [Mastigocoleus testarum]KST62432.1 glutathione S-transferase [Mastigocoleus testarum BC008]